MAYTKIIVIRGRLDKYQPFFRVNNEFKCSTFSGVNLECLAVQGVPRFFAKYVTLRKNCSKEPRISYS